MGSSELYGGFRRMWLAYKLGMPSLEAMKSAECFTQERISLWLLISGEYES